MSVCGRFNINPDKSKYIEKYINSKVDHNGTIPFGFTSSIDRKGNTNIYTYGKRDIEENLPFEPDSIYRMASQSKFMGVTGFLKLVDKQLVSLNEPLKNYLPEFSSEFMSVIEPYHPSPPIKTLLNPIYTTEGLDMVFIDHKNHGLKPKQTISLEWSNGSLDKSKVRLPDGNGIPGFELFNVHHVFDITNDGYYIKLPTKANKTGRTGSFVKIVVLPNDIHRSICLSPDKMLTNPKVNTHYYKKVPLVRDLTILDIITHGLGWCYYSSSMLYMSFGYAKHPLLRDIQAGIWNETELPIGLPLSCYDGNIRDWVKTSSQIPLLYQPGQDWSYGPQLSVLGALIEIIDGRSVEKYFKEELWDPLGMKNSGFFIHDNDPLYLDKKNRTSKLYINIPKIVTKLMGSDLFDNVPVEEAQYCLYEGPRNLCLIDCGMYTTVEDYLKFMQSFFNNNVLSEQMIKLISTYDTGYDVTNLSTVSGYSSGMSLPGTKSDIKREKLLTSMKWGLGVGTIRGCKNNPYSDNEEILAITWAGVLGTRFIIDFCAGIAHNAGTNVIGPPAGTIDADLIELNYKEISKKDFKQMIHKMIW